ncbi:Lrp/AsnC family transcriptional regulator [Sphingomonas colocasiae]|uniref:Lrp/AsnC family transcriptional regulator n=1 Tax=Sphingomonas colocasiae TaxID=1848973 RepID=A0ABS7PKN2_9SPHN|nr:Lrp/AsnC family transcriptional regulator [Sphingomonas colocasiae]MBY8821855.1 Lrp/AsnC family transcriptional regulator [Sphingomonas colocasiae]
MPDIDLDGFDRRILTELQRNGRLTNLDLAELIGLSPSPCLRRVKRLEQDGYITGYSARIDERKVGLGLTCFVSVKMERHREEDAEQLKSAIGGIREIISCFVTSGEYDMLLQIVVPDLDSFRRLMMTTLIKLPGVRDFRTSFAIDTIKDGVPLPLHHLPDPR